VPETLRIQKRLFTLPAPTTVLYSVICTADELHGSTDTISALAGEVCTGSNAVENTAVKRSFLRGPMVQSHTVK
jgi:hypothetical protein